MYKGRRVLLVAPACNEQAKIGEVIRRVPLHVVDKVLVVDDGSTDATARVARDAGASVLSLGSIRGVGFAIRAGFDLARSEGFDVTVVIAGNNKDCPEEIPRLLDPVCDANCDFVMGARYARGGRHGGDMPLYRRIATRLHPMLIGLLCGRRITESTNGFRAIRTSMLSDPRINLDQRWLNGYELEVYLLIKTLKLGFKYAEVPCTKIYPPKKIGQTKMRPFVDWWKMLRPIALLAFGLKK